LLEFPIALRAGLWAPPIFAPFQAFRFGSLDFVTDRLGTLHLREEATPLTSLEGDTPSNGPFAGLDTEVLAWRIEHMLSANPSTRNVQLLLFSLHNVFQQLYGGTPAVLTALTARSVPIWPHKHREHLSQGALKGPTTAPACDQVCGHEGVQSCLVPQPPL
jgi:hypothetical protein